MGLREQFDKMKPWFHNIEIDGVPTKIEPAWGEPMDPSSHIWEHLRHLDYRNKRVLDVGCNGGYFLVASRRAGAAECIGVEGDHHFASQARLVSELLGLGQIHVRSASAYDIDDEWGMFDISLLLGLIYHLKDPVRVIDRIAHVTRDVLVVETALRNSDIDLANRAAGVRGRPEMQFVGPQDHQTYSDKAILRSRTTSVAYEGAPNWWMPNTECVEALLKSAGFPKIEIAFEYLNPSSFSAGFGRALLIARR